MTSADAQTTLSDGLMSAQEEQRSCLKELLREHNEALVNYVYGRVRSRADAHDIVQEAYCRVLRLDEPRVAGHLRAFLYETAGNIAIDWLRKRKVRKRFVDEQVLRANSHALSPESVWAAREELECLARTIEALPPRTRLAVRLVRFEGASYEEVAGRLGIKTHSARKLVERATEYLLASVASDALENWSSR